MKVSTPSESALIGTILYRPATLDECGELTPFDFLDQELGRVFEALTLARSGGFLAGDLGHMLALLIAAGIDRSIASVEGVNRLVGACGIGSYAGYHAAQVRRMASVRRQVALCGRWSDWLSDDANDPAEVAEWVADDLATLGTGVSIKTRDFSDVASEVVDTLRAKLAAGDSGIGVCTGLMRLDDTLGGWHDGELVIVAARPGAGKTALAMQAAMYNGRRGRRVVYASLEMRDRELVTRVLCGESQVDGRRLRLGTFDAADVADIDATRAALEAVPVTIYDPPSATVERIQSVVRFENSRKPVSLIVVDYLQLIRSADGSKKRHEQIGEQTAALKSLAKDIGCPVLCLAQLNREAEGVEPQMSHLRESGSIEQDADMILAIHKTGDGTADLLILKHRAGQRGVVPLNWDGPSTSFSDPDDQFSNFNKRGVP